MVRSDGEGLVPVECSAPTELRHQVAALRHVTLCGAEVIEKARFTEKFTVR